MVKEEFKYMWAVGLAAFLLFPVVNEMLLCCKYAICRGRIKDASFAESKGLKDCIPIVYSSGYNIHAFGLEKLHPFDASKYRRVY